MKKYVFAFFFFVVVLGSFLAGSWYSRQEPAGVKPTTVTPASVATNEESKIDGSSLAAGTLKISPDKQQVIGVRVGAVERKPMSHTFRLLGRVAADETRIYRINASVDGWIKETFPNSVGSLVKKDEVLATFYSPAFLDAEQGYLYALGTVERLGPGRRLELGRKDAPNPASLDPYVVQRQIDVLRGMGMSDSQIEEIGRTRQFTLDIHITAPNDGFVTARNVSPGEKFLKGTELYRIADLSHVWILADVYEHEAQYFKPGLKAKLTSLYQKRSYQGTVSKVLPVFDSNTRTLKVRFETDNPGFLLRPDMFVDVELPISLSLTITIPSDAVLDSGLKKTVFVDHGSGFFEPREVETGWRLGNRVEITKGLVPGEKIAMSGTFLIDSESRMELAAAGMVGTLVKDPVCGADVSVNKAEKAGRKSKYKDVTYYFSSDECREKFDKNPEQYVTK